MTDSTGYAYSLILRNRTPIVNPGRTLEIEVFLSGFGVPPKNKLYIQWSSPYIIDQKNSGSYASNIVTATHKVTGKMEVGTGKTYVQTQNADKYGVTIYFSQGYFFVNPRLTGEYSSSFKQGVSEVEWDDEPPLLLKLNISPDAPSGDYDISSAFTYGDDQHILQDFKTVPFHITNRWERNQGWIEFVVAAIALVSLVIAAVSLIITAVK